MKKIFFFRLNLQRKINLIYIEVFVIKKKIVLELVGQKTIVQRKQKLRDIIIIFKQVLNIVKTHLWPWAVFCYLVVL